MNKKLIIAILILIVLAVAYPFLRRMGNAPASASLQPRPAPDFTLPQFAGPPLKLSDFRGKVVLLDFWATWCEPCRVETPHFVEMQDKYGSRGLQIIGVSMDDSPDPVPAFYKQFKMNYPVVMGNAKIGEEYGGVLGLPIAFLIDREGNIRKKHMGATAASVFDKEVADLLDAK